MSKIDIINSLKQRACKSFIRKNICIMSAFVTVFMLVPFTTGCQSQSDDDTIILRVANCEEYIDLGEWDEDELIELEDGTEIFGENALYEDFEDWFYETYKKKVKVEYSTYGTNEELYNQLTIGDVYDLVCPSEYMIMKMLREDMLVPYDDAFFDKEKANNYYAKGVSPYIDNVFSELSIDGIALHKYAAGYMWGTLGLVYNPEFVTEQEASHWNLLLDKNHYKQMTIKDSVRDAFFSAAAINYYDEITAPEFINSPDYHENLSEILNRTDEKTSIGVQQVLTEAKNNVYSFETDSGKADLVTGKVVATQQWSGDAVYSMDQADEDGVELCYSAPKEGTNLWFDGWVMLKCGIGVDSDKKLAAQEFVNYISEPTNVVRNMYYIGYTSTISGGDSDIIYEYLKYNYEAEDDEEETVEYPVGYFFTDDDSCMDDYVCIVPEDQTRRQLYAQYPPLDVIDRSVVMACFDDESNDRINRMWISVRCFDLAGMFK